MATPRRRTRIVATIGPSSSEPEQLRALLAAGVDVVRLNASHATLDFFSTMIPQIRQIALVLKAPPDSLVDHLVVMNRSWPPPLSAASRFVRLSTHFASKAIRRSSCLCEWCAALSALPLRQRSKRLLMAPIYASRPLSQERNRQLPPIEA